MESQARIVFAQLNGVRHHMLVWDTGAGDDVVILLHGLGGTAQSWELVARHLGATGFQLIALDMRGHGLSEKPSQGYSLSTFSRDLCDLVEHSGAKRCVLVGHSLGGYLALEYASRYANESQAPAAVVLVDGGIGQLNEFPNATWSAARDVLTRPDFENLPLEALLNRLRHPDRAWRPRGKALELILTSFEIDAQGRIHNRLHQEHYMKMLREVWEYPTFERYEKVRCPVLLIPVAPPKPWDIRDHAHIWLNEMGVDKAKAALDTVTVRWMRETVHEVLLQRPKALAKNIAVFLDTLP